MVIRFKVLTLILTVCAVGSTAQEKGEKALPTTRTMRFDAGNSVIIRELGAVITEENNKIIVNFIPPKERRPKENSAEDIEAGDEVGMANGKRVTKVSELKKQYDEAPVGSEFKLGVRRDGHPRIVTFSKKDPKDAMQGGMMIVSGDGSAEGVRFFPALGIGLEQKEKRVVIKRTLPHVLAGLKEGDTIETLNEKAISAVEDFEKVLDATKVGSELKFGIVRDGKNVICSAPRPEPRGQMMIRTN